MNLLDVLVAVFGVIFVGAFVIHMYRFGSGKSRIFEDRLSDWARRMEIEIHSVAQVRLAGKGYNPSFGNPPQTPSYLPLSIYAAAFQIHYRNKRGGDGSCVVCFHSAIFGNDTEEFFEDENAPHRLADRACNRELPEKSASI